MPIRIRGAKQVSDAGVCTEDLCINEGRVVKSVSRHAQGIDLEGYVLLPGLVNAHDHLHLNGISLDAAGNTFDNAYQWAEHVQNNLSQSMPQAWQTMPKLLRYRHGALKNILAGVTAVAHHDPWHVVFDEIDFPVRVLAQYAWCHSPGLAGQYGPELTCDKPDDRPWMIHLAEGSDSVAAEEYAQLKKFCSIDHNTVLIHALGMSAESMQDALHYGASVVWCPLSNANVLGSHLSFHQPLSQGRLALGSDSRLSGGQDLLHELKFVSEQYHLRAPELLSLVTSSAAKVLQWPEVGGLQPGQFADFVVLEDSHASPVKHLIHGQRAGIQAVIKAGQPVIASLLLSQKLGFSQPTATLVLLDGQLKFIASSMIDSKLVSLEPGLEYV